MKLNFDQIQTVNKIFSYVTKFLFIFFIESTQLSSRGGNHFL